MQVFDATQFDPQQGLPKHPPGMHDFQITNTYIKPTKDNSGGMLVVELTTPAGRIENRYNIYNQSAQAVEIANKQLSALCHAVGIFRLTFPQNPDGTPNMQMAAAELRGGRGRMEVGPQANNPEYMEVKRVFDAAGNEPGKGKSPAPPQGNANQGGWGQPQQQPSAQQWGQQAPPQPQQQAPQQAAPQQWTQQQAPTDPNVPPTPPWAR